jgi:hypothetical protein
MKVAVSWRPIKLLFLHLVGVPYYFTYNDDARSHTNQVYVQLFYSVIVHTLLPSLLTSLPFLEAWVFEIRQEFAEICEKLGCNRGYSNCGIARAGYWLGETLRIADSLNAPIHQHETHAELLRNSKSLSSCTFAPLCGL